MKSQLKSIFGAAVCWAGAAGLANAGVMATPILFLGDGTQLVCVANNVSALSLTMTVTIVGNTSNGTAHCTLPAGDRDGCQAFLNGQSGWCKITMGNTTNADIQTRLRGILFNRITVSPFSVFNTVEAR